MFERKIEKSETSIAKLQAHTERGSCPRDLRYVAKANITPDKEFKTDIHAIKREAERKFIGALTKCHYRCTERNKGKLRRAKSDISRSKKDTVRPGETPRAQPNSSSIVPESISNLSTTLEKKLEEINVLMKEIEEIKNKTCESYPCLFSECGTKKQREDKVEKRKIKNKKHNERKKKTQRHQRYKNRA